LMLNLDLVITVETMIAHLAGALARPVWTMLRYATNWRWQIVGDDTPWYPTMRLFRQQKIGDWGNVMGRIRLALAAATSDRSLQMESSSE
jgi:ADP-heptose:LPS heptosyltransferase